ncbi:odorant receptor 2a-like [Teleopsis dalmanni]|uniref:odorant receptor 2a-like n=1 Tax=Teleopsis dalmanni TaxID=139649 RepID=UPI0018CF1E72|nr:odorant receptor 2a-like [Teleopsis dalmanni]
MTSQIKTWEALTYQWKVWKFFGLVPPQEGSIWRLPYKILNCFQSQNVSEFCDNFYLTITVVVCTLKVLNVYLSINKLLKVRPILEELDKRAKSQAEDDILLKGKKDAKECLMFYVRVCFLTYITGNLIVYLSNERRLMYPAWYPWNWKNSFKYYAISYIYQLYALTAFAVMECINATYASMHMRLLSAHIGALGIRIQNIGWQENTIGNNEFDFKQHEENVYAELINCIKEHEIIVKLFKITESTISSTFLIQFISTGLAQCTLGVFFLYHGFSVDMNLLNIIFFFIAVSYMTFNLCYYGTQLQDEFQNLNAALYSCNWMDQNKKFKKSLLFLLHRSQIYDNINAYILPITLPTFLKG